MKLNFDNDKLLTEFAKDTLSARYLMPNEKFQELFARNSAIYSDDTEHAQRLYDYQSKLWFMPATPILSNAGAERGLPISCFLNEADDNLDSISGLWNENVNLSACGGGIGSYWGNVRSMSDGVRFAKTSSGVIPFMKVQESLTLAISQGGLRRGSSAAYLPINHPEVEDFLDMRKPTGGDPNRKCPGLHHGLMITDNFMEAVEKGLPWDLISPKNKRVTSTIDARTLWFKILTTRLETGEPYIGFTDTINRLKPEIYKRLDRDIKMSNLCSEIVLNTSQDKTAVCCLSSLNLEFYDDWKDDPIFIEDILKFLDNVLDKFISNKYSYLIPRAVFSARRERSVGLGVMGLHSYLQAHMIPIEKSTEINDSIFKHIKKMADNASFDLAEAKDECYYGKMCGVMERFTHKTAIAPTASISIIANTSPGIEPIVSNYFTHKNLGGSFSVKNKYLQKLLIEKGKDTEDVWANILLNYGSVKELTCLTDYEKEVFKTAFEINQLKLVELAADRTKYIDQSQSLTLFFKGDVEKKHLHDCHFAAWKLGVKTMYYIRSLSIQRAKYVCSDEVCHSCCE